MRVFITGGPGFIGTALTSELIRSGHQVLALARTDESAAKLKKLGAQIQMGSDSRARRRSFTPSFVIS